MKRSSRPALPTRVVLAAASAAALWLAASPAQAQMVHVPDSDWRQTDRHDSTLNAGSPQRFAVELRFGPYLPSIDSEFTGKTPFADIFGLDCNPTVNADPNKSTMGGKVSPRFYFGVEFDYLPLRIPYVGVFGGGLGWGFTSFSNYANFVSAKGGAANCSQETTTLTIMPMYASLVLRFDELMRRTRIPIVPYGKAGVGLAWWRASTDAGTEVCKPESGNCAKQQSGMGLTPSLHFAVGGMLALNFLDYRAAARLDETTGVNHAYLFGEYMNEQIPLTKSAMHVGTSTAVVGLAADF
jgi:hypothetical protein